MEIREFMVSVLPQIAELKEICKDMSVEDFNQFREQTISSNGNEKVKIIMEVIFDMAKPEKKQAIA